MHALCTPRSSSPQSSLASPTTRTLRFSTAATSSGGRSGATRRTLRATSPAPFRRISIAICPGPDRPADRPPPVARCRKARGNARALGRRRQRAGGCVRPGQRAYGARAWWLLRWLGHEKVAVYWMADSPRGRRLACPSRASRPLANRAPSRRASRTARSSPPHRCSKRWRTESIALIDARGADRFAGENETIDPVAGHVPGATESPVRRRISTPEAASCPPTNYGVSGRSCWARARPPKWSRCAAQASPPVTTCSRWS